MEEKTINKDNQVKSKKRVTDHGEVFTSEREVNAMLDLVKQETERIDSRFLEPACGTGNFLVEILRRKLKILENRYKKSQLEFERYTVIAISSIYGVDILEDNVVECRNRLFEIFDEKYTSFYKTKCKEECRTSINNKRSNSSAKLEYKKKYYVDASNFSKPDLVSSYSLRN